MNLNNVLPALCDASFKQVYRDPLLRSLAVGLMREGIAVAQRAGIRLEPIPGTSVPLVRLVAHLPTALAGAVVQRVTSGRRYLAVREIEQAFQAALGKTAGAA